MFPTTVWTTIRAAGADDEAALDCFVRAYRNPVLRYIRSRGFPAEDGEDVCQEVFLRLLRGKVLARADARRGRFRALLLSVTKHVILDRLRKRGETPLDDLDPAARDAEFDREWVLEISERALARMKSEGSPYYAVLEQHLAGERTDRNKLWIARRKLTSGIRHEVALTCGSPEEFEDEVAYLARFLRPAPPDPSEAELADKSEKE